MSNQIQFNTFNFHSNAVRVITDPTGEFWFCGRDICTILGYVNESLTLQKHCKQNGVSKRYLTDKMQRKQEAIFINEPNLYRLIIKSRKPEAEPFEAWVFEEVLPQIRKTGKYSLEQQQLALPEPEKTYTFEFTEYELEQLAWLWFSHKRMNTLLADLYEPLNALGSTFSGSVYSHAHEYHRHHKESQATMQRLIEPFKHSTKLNWQRVIPRISPTQKQLGF
ncbi:BRO family protein [Avibacterium paragallinarum]|uniref:BRO family protein n=1 Tax=Avibacterium paragallinarum TaxID=728 RepID=UPI0039784650